MIGSTLLRTTTSIEKSPKFYRVPDVAYQMPNPSRGVQTVRVFVVTNIILDGLLLNIASMRPLNLYQNVVREAPRETMNPRVVSTFFFLASWVEQSSLGSPLSSLGVAMPIESIEAEPPVRIIARNTSSPAHLSVFRLDIVESVSVFTTISKRFIWHHLKRTVSICR